MHLSKSRNAIYRDAIETAMYYNALQMYYNFKIKMQYIAIQ